MSSCTKETIKQLIDVKAKESSRRFYLQQKDCVQNPRNAQKLAKLISGIANAEGGEIYCGILMKRKRASGFYSLEDIQSFKTWIKIEVLESVSPLLKDISVTEISISDENVIVTIEIPNSFDSPHRCNDGQYYKASEQGVVCLDEPEIRAMYTQALKPQIDVWAVQNAGGVPQLQGGKFSVVNFYPRVFVKNIGTAVENVYKIELSVPTAINNNNFDVLQQYFSHFNDGYTVYVYTNSSPLFPDELASTFEANFFINGDNYKMFEGGYLKLKIYYSSGYKEKSIRLKELLLYRHTTLEESDFVESQMLIK